MSRDELNNAKEKLYFRTHYTFGLLLIGCCKYFSLNVLVTFSKVPPVKVDFHCGVIFTCVYARTFYAC